MAGVPFSHTYLNTLRTRYRGDMSEKRPAEHRAGAGIALGVAFGAVFGLLFHNVALGLALGIAIGAGYGVTWKDLRRSRRADRR